MDDPPPAEAPAPPLRSETRHGWAARWDVLAVFLAMAGLFAAIVAFSPTDIQAHLQQIQRINEGEADYLPNFLFFWLVNALSGFSTREGALQASCIALLAAATAAKYAISLRWLRRGVGGVGGLGGAGGGHSTAASRAWEAPASLLVVLGVSLLFYFALVEPWSWFVRERTYLGRFVAVVWHNSTTIFLMPFAMALFAVQLRALRSRRGPGPGAIACLAVLVLLNVAVKPSFLFAWIPGTCLFLLPALCAGRWRFVAGNAAPVAFALLLIVGQYLAIYHLQRGSFNTDPSGMGIGEPFEVMRIWMPGWFLPVAFAVSFAFPAAAWWLHRGLMRDPAVAYALVLLACGIAVGAVFLETGPRRHHGNLLWQNVVCSYLLVVTTVAFLLRRRAEGAGTAWGWGVLQTLFTLHVASGVLYAARLLVTGKFG